MGMLLHRTWLEQQKAAKKPNKTVSTAAEAEKPEEEVAPVKKTGGRRKTAK